MARHADGDRRVEGLLLLASYPATRLERADEDVLAVVVARVWPRPRPLGPTAADSGPAT